MFKVGNIFFLAVVATVLTTAFVINSVNSVPVRQEVLPFAMGPEEQKFLPNIYRLQEDWERSHPGRGKRRSSRSVFDTVMKFLAPVNPVEDIPNPHLVAVAKNAYRKLAS